MVQVDAGLDFQVGGDTVGSETFSRSLLGTISGSALVTGWSLAAATDGTPAVTICDDDFNGDALHGDWAVYGFYSVTPTFSGGFLCATGPQNNFNSRHNVIARPHGGQLAGRTITCKARCSDANNDFQRIGFGVVKPSTGEGHYIDLVSITGVWYWRRQSESGYSNAFAGGSALTNPATGLPDVWFRLVFDNSGNCGFYASPDGVTYTLIDTLAVNLATYTHVALHFQGADTSDVHAQFDFVHGMPTQPALVKNLTSAADYTFRLAADSASDDVVVRTEPPHLRAPAVTAVGTDVYIVGGSRVPDVVGGSGAHAEEGRAWRKTIGRRDWVGLPRLPVNLDYGEVTMLAGRLHFVGGQTFEDNSGAVATHYSLEPGVDSAWVTETPLPQPNDAGGLVALGGRLYYVGGWSTSGPMFDTVLSWAPGEGSWTLDPAHLPRAINGFGCVTLGGRIYVVGGEYNPAFLGVALDEVHSWAPGEPSWTAEPSMPSTLWRCQSAVLDGRIYAVGGWVDSGASTGSAAVFSWAPGELSWTTETSLPFHVAHGKLVAANGRLYYVLGEDTTGYRVFTMNQLWTWAPGESQWRQEDTGSPVFTTAQELVHGGTTGVPISTTVAASGDDGSLVPTDMTNDNSHPPYVVGGRSPNNPEIVRAWTIFDDLFSISGDWAGQVAWGWFQLEWSPGDQAWVDIDMGAPVLINGYKLQGTSTGGQAGIVPTDWTLRGSNDGTTYTDLDQRTGADVDDKLVTFPVSPGVAYRYYRLFLQNPALTGFGVHVARILRFKLLGASSGITYSATDLPPGLSIDETTGQITGTPTAAGTYETTITATNRLGSATLSATFNIVQGTAQRLLILPRLIDTALTLRDGMSIDRRLMAVGAPTSWVAYPLPNGLELDRRTGRLHGTPTEAGVWDLHVSVANADGASSGTIRLTVLPAPPDVGGTVLPNGRVGASYSHTLAATGAASSMTVAGLPPGLTFDPATWVVSGTPTVGGAYSVYITVSGPGGSSTQVDVVSIEQLSWRMVETVHDTYQAPPGTTGTYAATGMPGWMSLNTSSGVLSGTPPRGSAGTYQVTLSRNSVQQAVLKVVVQALQGPRTPYLSSGVSSGFRRGQVRDNSLR